MSYIPYPDILDKNFITKLNKKYEFAVNKTDGDKWQTQEEACNLELFKLFKHQRALKNFFNPLTHYRSLLLVNALGSGKTCSSISIAESHKRTIKSSGQKIIVLLEKGVEENYINELYNPDKNENQCIGNTYSNDNKRKIRQKINQVYDIVRLDTFVNWVNNMTLTRGGYDIIKKRFSNTLIIVDEVHNIKVKDTEIEQEDLKRYDAFALALSLAENSKLLLMSATPMYDSATEIVSLINLFKLNERESSKNYNKDLVRVGDVFDSKQKLKKSGKDIIRRELMGRVSYVGQNPVTFPKVQFAQEAKAYNLLKMLKVISCPMSDKHFEVYKQNLDQPIANIRQIGNIVPKYEKKDLTRSALLDPKNSVSIKFGKLVENIENVKGPVFVYSEFINFGVQNIREILKQNGYVEYSNKSSPKSKKSFILLEGGTESKKRQRLINTFNSKENKDGNVIKVIIGSIVLKEGISLKNTRSVHIMDPWFNVSRLKQVWGRAIRSCSHVLLKPADRKVDIYLYSSMFPIGMEMKKPKSFLVPFSEVQDIISQNLYAYKQSEEKEFIIQDVINILREIAIDCNLHQELNKNKEDGISCVGRIDKTSKPDKTTYDLDKTIFTEALVDLAIKVIKHEIRRNLSVSIKKLLKLDMLKSENIDEELLNMAIYAVVPNEQTDYTTFPHFMQINNQIGYIINKGKYLIFQPLDGDQKKKSKREKISMFERINPSSVKFKNIPYEKNLSIIHTEEDVNKQKLFLDKLKLKDVKIMRDDVIKNNIKGILKTNGELLLLQQHKGKNTIDQRKKSRGRMCKTFNGSDMLKLVEDLGIPKDQYKTFFTEKDNKIRVKDKDILCIIIRDFFYPDVNLPSPISSSVSSSSRKTISKKVRKGEKSLVVKELGRYRFKIVEINGKEMFKIGNKNVTDRGSKHCSVKRKEDLIAIAEELKITVNQRMTRKNLCDKIQEFVFRPTP